MRTDTKNTAKVKKISTTGKQEGEPGYWNGMQLLKLEFAQDHSCLEWSGYLMTRNSQEHIFTAGTPSCTQHYPAINETGV